MMAAAGAAAVAAVAAAAAAAEQARAATAEAKAKAKAKAEAVERKRERKREREREREREQERPKKRKRQQQQQHKPSLLYDEKEAERQCGCKGEFHDADCSLGLVDEMEKRLQFFPHHTFAADLRKKQQQPAYQLPKPEQRFTGYLLRLIANYVDVRMAATLVMTSKGARELFEGGTGAGAGAGSASVSGVGGSAGGSDRNDRLQFECTIRSEFDKQLRHRNLSREDGERIEVEYPLFCHAASESFWQPQFTPKVVLPFLDMKLLEEKRYRFARVSNEQAQKLGYKELERILDACAKYLIFCVIEGMCAKRKEFLGQWLSTRNNVSGELSGRDGKGEQRQELKVYADRLHGYKTEEARWIGVLGTFTVKGEGPQLDDLNWLDSHPVLGPFLHRNEKGGMAGMGMERTQLGPYSFGGDQRRKGYKWQRFQEGYQGGGPAAKAAAVPAPAAAAAAAAAPGSSRARRSQVNEESDPRKGYGGSTMHLDGMGTYFAAGYIKDGEKHITAVEAHDALYALKEVGFRAYAKPGGSEHATNVPLTQQLLRRWDNKHVRWGDFHIKEGDFYFIPAGIPHEFENVRPSLSVAWNFLPKGVGSNELVLHHMYYAHARLRTDLGHTKDRMNALMDHAPEILLWRRLQLRVSSAAAASSAVETVVQCEKCGSWHALLPHQMWDSGPFYCSMIDWEKEDVECDPKAKKQWEEAQKQLKLQKQQQQKEEENGEHEQYEDDEAEDEVEEEEEDEEVDDEEDEDSAYAPSGSRRKRLRLSNAPWSTGQPRR